MLLIYLLYNINCLVCNKKKKDFFIGIVKLVICDVNCNDFFVGLNFFVDIIRN